MEATAYIRMVRRWWWLLAASLLTGAVAAYAASGLVTPTYRSTATLLVVQQQDPGVIQRNDLETSALLANTFSRMITIRPLLQEASDTGDLGLSPGALRRSLAISNVQGTQLLEVEATASDPLLARDIANIVSEVFIASEEAQLTSGTGSVSIIEPATAPNSPIAPRKTLNAMLGGILGLLGCGLLVILFEYLDDTVKTPQQVLDLAGLSTIGRLPVFRRVSTPAEQLKTALEPHSATAEEYRALRTNLSNALRPVQGGGYERKVVLVTSPNMNEGKSTTAANLAVVLGLAGHRVALIDGDLRRPTLHRIFSLDNSEGLSTLLISGRGSIAHAAQRTPHGHLVLIPAGPSPSNPSELLGSGRMRQLLQELRSEFDAIVIDSSPVLSVTDASVLASSSDAVLLVVRPGRTRTSDLQSAVEQLAGSGTALAGLVMNRDRSPDVRRRYGYGVMTRGGDATPTPSPAASPVPAGANDDRIAGA